MAAQFQPKSLSSSTGRESAYVASVPARQGGLARVHPMPDYDAASGGPADEKDGLCEGELLTKVEDMENLGLGLRTRSFRAGKSARAKIQGALPRHLAHHALRARPLRGVCRAHGHGAHGHGAHDLTHRRIVASSPLYCPDQRCRGQDRPRDEHGACRGPCGPCGAVVCASTRHVGRRARGGERRRCCFCARPVRHQPRVRGDHHRSLCGAPRAAVQANVVMQVVVFNAKNKERRLQTTGIWVILPDGTFRRRWDLIMTVLLVFISVFTPYQLAFMRETSYLNVCAH